MKISIKNFKKYIIYNKEENGRQSMKCGTRLPASLPHYASDNVNYTYVCLSGYNTTNLIEFVAKRPPIPYLC